ncbi:hypothetical protein CR513_11633, partial [Mucuna pruriens]
MEEATSANDSNSVLINNNDIMEKGNVYGLGKLTNKFMRSIHIQTNLIDMPMVYQMEEMRETIHKLNNELVEKTTKEKSLEEKVLKSLMSAPTTPDNNDDHGDNT